MRQSRTKSLCWQDKPFGSHESRHLLPTAAAAATPSESNPYKNMNSGGSTKYRNKNKKG